LRRTSPRGRETKAAAAKAEKTKISGKIIRKQRSAKLGEKPDADAPRGLGEVESADLEPIEVVRRELTRPDGSVVVVEVPVYPPFRLSEQPGARKAPPRNRSAPTLKGKRRRKAGAGES
jgi:hypothetical protein